MIIDRLFAFILLLVGLTILQTKELSWKNMNLDFSENYLYIYIGLGLIQLGLIWLYTIFKNKATNKLKYIEFSKCPKCKTAYNYSDLKDGICPKCDIKTVETEEYYKKYPEELEDV